jgi:hypothetical protein
VGVCRGDVGTGGVKITSSGTGVDVPVGISGGRPNDGFVGSGSTIYA